MFLKKIKHNISADTNVIFVKLEMFCQTVAENEYTIC